jgi:hypothetical protein
MRLVRSDKKRRIAFIIVRSGEDMIASIIPYITVIYYFDSDGSRVAERGYRTVRESVGEKARRRLNST